MKDRILKNLSNSKVGDMWKDVYLGLLSFFCLCHHLLFWDQQWHQGYNSVDWYWQQLSMAPHYWFMLSVNDLRDPWSLLWLQAWKHSLPDCLWALGWGRGWLSLWLRQKQQPLHSGPGSWGSETTTSSELTQAPSRLNSGLFILCYYFILE